MTPLRPEDIDTLAPLGQPRWRRRVMAGAAAATALVVVLVHAAVSDSQHCTSACDTQLGAVSVGLAFGLLVVVAWSPYAGAALAVAFVVVTAVDDAQSSGSYWPTWVYVLDAVLVVVCVAGLYAPRGTAATAEWLATAVHSRPTAPAPFAERAAADWWRAVGWLLVIGATVAGAWMWSRHYGEDDQLGWWLALAVFGGAVGVGVVGYRWADDKARQRPFESDGPVCDVLVHRWWSEVEIYPAGSELKDSAVLIYRQTGGDPARADQDLVTRPPTGLVPAQLYGVPAEGRWCVAVVDGVALTPAGPLRRVPPVAEDLDDDEDEDELDDEESTVEDVLAPFFRLTPEEIERLDPGDRDAEPREVRLHRQQPVWAYLVTSFLLVLIALKLPRMPLVPALTVAAVVQAGLCFMGWWTILRPRIAWNGGGLAAVDHRRSVRVRWEDVTFIVAMSREVRVLIGNTHISVPNTDGFGRLRWAVPGTGRSTDELVLALKYAWQRRYDRRDEMAAIEPPRLEPTRPPLLLYAFWLAGTLAVAGLLAR